jgi:hypothetical protein
MHLKKGDKVKYLGNMPYKLGNEQEVEKEGDELIIRSNVQVQQNFFEVVEEKKEEKVVEPELKESPKKEEIKKDNKKLDKKSKK